MIAYGIGIIPLIKNLKREIPDVTQPWYSDDARALGMFARIETYFYSLTRLGLGRGYHPKPSNMEHVMGLRCALAHVILGVTSGTSIPNTIVLESLGLHGRRTS